MVDKYKYTYEIASNYCYYNSNVLVNKLNNKNEKDLYIAEQELVGLRIKEMM